MTAQHDALQRQLDDARSLVAQVEAARASLQQMNETLRKSKADRAALVDYALRSLMQLSSHLSLTLAALKVSASGLVATEPAARG